MNYQEKFLERGITPLEPVTNHKQKVSCIDKDGYKYLLCYHNHIADTRTKSFNKWSKRNPYKAYNMRLLASRVQENVNILSTDEELRNATTQKVKFQCPICGQPYEKKWCHWLGQEDNRHFCPECSNELSTKNKIHTFQEIYQRYLDKGFTLLESSDFFNCGGGHKRLECCDIYGYKYLISLNSLTAGNLGNNKYSATNPHSVENLQLSCDKLKRNVKICKIIKSDNSRTLFEVQCQCGNIYKEESYKILSQNGNRCPVCRRRESQYELLTRKWLEDNNIVFQEQFRFNDCRFHNPLPFDFRCEWNNKIILIEVDGGQHYYITQWTDEEKLRQQKLRDKLKTDYAKKNGYVLLRIPFWLFKTGSYIKILEKCFSE